MATAPSATDLAAEERLPSAFVGPRLRRAQLTRARQVDRAAQEQHRRRLQAVGESLFREAMGPIDELCPSDHLVKCEVRTTGGRVIVSVEPGTISEMARRASTALAHELPAPPVRVAAAATLTAHVALRSGARARGAGRPRGRRAATRSCARSGDSGDDGPPGHPGLAGGRSRHSIVSGSAVLA